MTAVTSPDAIQDDRSGDLSTRSGQWVQSPLWDGFWMFSALWGSALLYAMNSGIGWKRASIILFIGNGVLALYHSWSTTYMVLGSSRMRTARAANQRRYLWTPLAIVVGAMSIGVLTGQTRSFPTTDHYGFDAWPWVTYLALFWVGHFWHFGKQDFGVLSLYRSRAGQLDLRARQIDQIYSRAMMFAIQPVVYLSILTHSPAGQAFYSYVPISPGTVGAIATGAVILASILTLVVVGIELARPNSSIPKLAYYCIMLTHPIVLYYTKFGLAFYYLIAYFWSHWFIAIGLVSRINSGHYRALGYRPATSVARHFLTIGAIAAFVILTTRNFNQFRIFSGRGYKEILASVTPEQGLVVGIFLGLFLSEQLLHYYCDRCLFRMRDSEVRKAIGPLL